MPQVVEGMDFLNQKIIESILKISMKSGEYMAQYIIRWGINLTECNCHGYYQVYKRKNKT